MKVNLKSCCEVVRVGVYRGENRTVAQHLGTGKRTHCGFEQLQQLSSEERLLITGLLLYITSSLKTMI